MTRRNHAFGDEEKSRDQSLKSASSIMHLKDSKLNFDPFESFRFESPTLRTPTGIAEKARSEWRLHGEGISQASEEKRRPLSNLDVTVRIVAVESRKDVSGSPYSTYVISVLKDGASMTSLVERRYGDFSKLNTLTKNHNINLGVKFPPKHWAGRIGKWTPSLSLAPETHKDLLSYRKVQLDIWLVSLVALYNRHQLPPLLYQEVLDFLTALPKPPCERENDLAPHGKIERNIIWSNPLSFTLRSAIRQAAYTVQYMCGHGISKSDLSIPLDLIQQAKGLCFLTVVKAGMVVSGKIGSGLVISRKADGTWSAPLALGTIGVGWGAQIGGDITHYLILLTTHQALDSFIMSSTITLGAELGVAVGPVGRGATSHISSSSILQPAYAYAHSQGLFVGISLQGSILNVRHDLNTNFYGRPVEASEVLRYLSPPKAAKPLYDALNEALTLEIPEDGIRPSALFASESIPKTPNQYQPSCLTGNLAASSPSFFDAQNAAFGYKQENFVQYRSP
jgi:lipid-binding SYLF domain-containing protein